MIQEFTVITLLCLLMVAMLSYDPTRYDNCIRLKLGRCQVFLFRCWYPNSWKLSSGSFVFPFGVVTWK
jgi:hypothetical protein